jgi:hypothetical protein
VARVKGALLLPARVVLTHQLAGGLALALVLLEFILGELLIALQAPQPLDGLGGVHLGPRLGGRAVQQHRQCVRGGVARLP